VILVGGPSTLFTTFVTRSSNANDPKQTVPDFTRPGAGLPSNGATTTHSHLNFSPTPHTSPVRFPGLHPPQDPKLRCAPGIAQVSTRQAHRAVGQIARDRIACVNIVLVDKRLDHLSGQGRILAVPVSEEVAELEVQTPVRPPSPAPVDNKDLSSKGPDKADQQYDQGIIKASPPARRLVGGLSISHILCAHKSEVSVRQSRIAIDLTGI